MPSIKIPRKSTSVDMTPFVDVAFLILTFFIMATKFKPPEPVKVMTPGSVNSEAVPENDAIQITMDENNKVYFTVLSSNDRSVFNNVLVQLNSLKNLGLGKNEAEAFAKSPMVGVPFGQLKEYLNLDEEKKKRFTAPGIPLDSTGGDLTYWIQASKAAFAGKKLSYLIKGDNKAKYPVFKDVISALKRNDEFKYKLVTVPEEAPKGTELYYKNKGIPMPQQ